MNTEGKTAAVFEWLKTCPEVGELLKLNAVGMESGEKAVQTSANDAALREYIDGSADRRLTFALVAVADWSEGYDGVNAEAQALGERWLDWCAAQFAAGNVPDLGEGCEVLAVKPLQDSPTLAVVYQERRLAKYQLQLRLTYRERA